MNLNKITEPCEGMIYESTENMQTPVGELLKGSRGVFLNGKIEFYVPEKDCVYYFTKDCDDFKKIKFFGLIDITHTLKDGKLVKIERDEIAVGDVFECKTRFGSTYKKVCVSTDEGYCNFLHDDGEVESEASFPCECKRIGIADLNINYIEVEG